MKNSRDGLLEKIHREICARKVKNEIMGEKLDLIDDARANQLV